MSRDLESIFIPVPNVVLLGCQAWPPSGQVGTCCLGCGADVSPDDPRCGACGTRIPAPDGPCPVHGDQIRPEDDRVVCGWCDSMNARNEHQVRTARIGLAAASRAAKADEDSTRDLRGKVRGRHGQVELTEVERRWLWNGYKGGILAENPDLTDRAKTGRDFLRSIDQCPDWSKVLNKFGKTVGRETPAIIPIAGGVAV
jgi:hypothetical protein